MPFCEILRDICRRRLFSSSLNRQPWFYDHRACQLYCSALHHFSPLFSFLLNVVIYFNTVVWLQDLYNLMTTTFVAPLSHCYRKLTFWFVLYITFFTFFKIVLYNSIIVNTFGLKICTISWVIVLLPTKHAREMQPSFSIVSKQT